MTSGRATCDPVSEMDCIGTGGCFAPRAPMMPLHYTSHVCPNATDTGAICSTDICPIGPVRHINGMDLIFAFERFWHPIKMLPFYYRWPAWKILEFTFAFQILFWISRIKLNKRASQISPLQTFSIRGATCPTRHPMEISEKAPLSCGRRRFGSFIVFEKWEHAFFSQACYKKPFKIPNRKERNGRSNV